MPRGFNSKMLKLQSRFRNCAVPTNPNATCLICHKQIPLASIASHVDSHAGPNLKTHVQM